MGRRGETVNEPTEAKSSPAPSAGPAAGAKSRESDAIYQGGRMVARAVGAEVDLKAKEIRFGEIHNSDDLVIPDECEFRNYRILIQRIAFATRIQRGEEHQGRVLGGVTCDVLGYLDA
jgi:hypothetical protein